MMGRSGKPGLMPVAEALARILATAPAPLETEHVALGRAHGRTLAADLAAKLSQPPAAVSAMDGYAVRAADIAEVPTELRLIGASAAGHSFAGRVSAGDCVRIFTGAHLPEGADTILIQENARAEGERVTALQSEPLGRFVRAAGLDFNEGDVLLKAGQRLDSHRLALAAAMNHARLSVVRRPRVAVLATGDELVAPGGHPSPDQIVASNTFGVAAAIEAAGGEAVDLGIARDRHDDLERAITRAVAEGADILVTLGGASVGEHDLVQEALRRAGMDLGFWKIAMRPGKPFMHGRIGAMRVLGLPGNPVSSLVCTKLFVTPLVRALLGDPGAGADPTQSAILGADLPANDERQDYLRASLRTGADSLPVATPFRRQDSSMLRLLADADALIVRPPFAPAAKAGEACRIVPF